MSFAIDIIGYWQNKHDSNIIIKITETTIGGIPYKLVKKENNKITVIMRGASQESYFISNDENDFIFINTNGEKLHFKLLTHDIALPYADVVKFSRIRMGQK